MALLDPAPTIQEEILFLPRMSGGRDAKTERQIRPIAIVPDWKQRAMWGRVRAESCARTGEDARKDSPERSSG